MVKIILSAEEKIILQKYFNTSGVQLIRLKAQAVNMQANGIRLKDISVGIFRSERTVRRWINNFLRRRMASVFSGLIGNEYAAKLTRKQKEEIRNVLKQKPSEYGLPKEFWDVPQLKQYVFARFGNVYESDRSYHFLLEFGNLSFKQPDKFNVKRDEYKTAKRMEEIYEEILPLFEDENWEIFCSDETRIVLEAIRRRAWLKKGEKTVIKVERSDDYQNYIGFLNQKSFKCHLFEIAWGNQEEIIKATNEFIKFYPDKKICIIWDNAKCHKGRLMREALFKGGSLEKIHLIALPPYAPDCNPIEHVWETGKAKLSNKQFKEFSETKQKFIKLTDNNYFPYQI